MIMGLAWFLSSCLRGNDVNIDEWHLGNAQIASFSLSNDSISGLSDVKFTIDQVNGKIFNKDSLPFETVIDRKVICTITFEIASPGVLMVNTVTNDTVYWIGNDSIDFSAPVMITVYSYDASKTKTYEAKINIHQVNPDSMAWQLLSYFIPEKTLADAKTLAVGDQYFLYVRENASQTIILYQATASNLAFWTPVSLTGFPDDAVLSQITWFGNRFYVFDEEGVVYRSADGQTWTVMDETPVLKALLGIVPEGGNLQTSVLTGIINENGALLFASMNEQREWISGNEIPANFPLTGFGQTTYETMYHQYLVIASGRDIADHLSDLTWSTTDGLSWTPLTKDGYTFSQREGAALYHQGDTLYLIGGVDGFGTALRDVYYSKDKGITWYEDTIHVMPVGFEARGFSSALVDKDNFVLLFGGKAGRDKNVMNEIWCGRINRLGFKDD